MQVGGTVRFFDEVPGEAAVTIDTFAHFEFSRAIRPQTRDMHPWLLPGQLRPLSDYDERPPSWFKTAAKRTGLVRGAKGRPPGASFDVRQTFSNSSTARARVDKREHRRRRTHSDHNGGPGHKGVAVGDQFTAQ